MAKDDIQDAEGEGGPKSDTFMTGLVLFTSVALIAAFVVIEMAYGKNYGQGLFK